jgi:hypothetical protein
MTSDTVLVRSVTSSIVRDKFKRQSDGDKNLQSNIGKKKPQPVDDRQTCRQKQAHKASWQISFNVEAGCIAGHHKKKRCHRQYASSSISALVDGKWVPFR